jgi:hypothetical protein
MSNIERSLDSILTKVRDELVKQNTRWGEQNHPLVREGYEKAVTITDFAAVNFVDEDGDVHSGISRVTAEASYFDFASALQASNDTREKTGEQAWDAILLEEVMEAFSAESPDDQVAELVQVAAVSIQAAASIERNSDG